MDEDISITTPAFYVSSFTNNMTTDDDSESTTIDLDDEWQRILVAVIFMIASIAGIIGNSLVILSVVLSRKLRSPTNVFVVNLSVADLLTCLAIPWNVVALLSFDGWPIADWVCSVAAVVLYVPTSCSVLTLASIGINRLILITKPVHVYQTIFATKVLCVWITMLWIWPFLLTAVPPLVGFGELGYNERFHSCSSVSSNEHSDQYDMIVAMAIYPIPLITILISYVWIFAHVRKVANKLQGTPAEDSVTMTVSPRSSPKTARKTKSPRPSVTELNFPPNNNPQQQQQRPKSAVPARLVRAESESELRAGSHSLPRTKREMADSSSAANKPRAGVSFSKRLKQTIRTATTLNRVSRRQLAITKNMFYVVVAYMICLTPFVFCLVIDSDISSVLIPYSSALIFFNSCINPMIYATKHPYFKKIFGLLLRCDWDKIPEPSDALRALRGRGMCISSWWWW